MLTSEFVLMIALGILASTGVTRPPAPVQPVQIVVVGRAMLPDVQTTVYGAEWCAPCRAYAKDLTANMVKDGWIVKPDTDKDCATAHVILTKSDKEWKALGIEKIPCTIIRKNGKEVHRFTGRKSADDLEKLINTFAKDSK